MMSTSALRRAITTDACRTNNTTDSTRRSARSSPVQALRFWRIRRDVPPSSWERPETGRSFQYLTTDRITQLYDFTVEEELAYYRQQISEQLFLEAFRSPGPTRYHLREEVLEELVRQLMVPTVRTPIGCSFASPCMCVVRETYASLVQRGLLIEIQRRKPYGTMTHKLLRMPALRALFPTGR